MVFSVSQNVMSGTRLAEARIDLNQSLRLDPLAAIHIIDMLSFGDSSTLICTGSDSDLANAVAH